MAKEQTNFNSILVIDDNEDIHRDFRKIFAKSTTSSDLDDLVADIFGEEKTEAEKIEFELQFASQGKQGLEVLKKAQAEGIEFGLAFVDMRMPPGWDGVETIEQLWKVDPNLQVVICTAYSDRSWEEIFEKLGCTDKLLILKKPFDSIEVIQIATSLSEKRRLLQKSKAREASLRTVVQTQEDKLTEAHNDAEILIESMSNVLVSLDEDRVVSKWNPVAAEVFEIETRQAIGQAFESLPIKWINREELISAFEKSIDQKEVRFETQFADSGNQTRTLEITICPIVSDNSNARLLLANDITTQRALQVQLDQALRMESVGQLAAGVAHEINTPMQYIGDNVRFVSKSFKKLDAILDVIPLLVDSDVPDTQIAELRSELIESFKPRKVKNSLSQIPEALQDSIDGVKSVAKIVAAMKEFSHPGADEKSNVCLNHILDSTLTVAKNEWKYVAEVETDFEKDGAEIEGLASELNQAFLNIIVNASHAIGDRVSAGDFELGKIKVGTRSDGDNVVVTIEDNGGGIPAHVRERVFEPFFTTKEVGKGTGQGLSIAFIVVTQKHGGELTFAVEEGVGTTFCITLPKQSATNESETAELFGAEA